MITVEDSNSEGTDLIHFMASCSSALIVLTFRENLSEKYTIFTKEEIKKYKILSSKYF